jgi:hypothetical protein
MDEGGGYRPPVTETKIMEFDDLSKRMAVAIEEAERVAPTGMFAQLLYHLSTALRRQKQWPLVAREAAFMAAEIGILNFFEWLHQIHPCQEPIRKAFRLANHCYDSSGPEAAASLTVQQGTEYDWSYI